MARQVRTAAWAAAACVALVLSTLRPAAANPGCSLSDIGQAAKDTFTNIPASCAAQAADPVFYPLLGFLIGFLQTPQGTDFCNAAESVDASASDAQKQLAGYWSKLTPDQQESLMSFLPILGDLSSGASDVGGGLDVVSCACRTAQWKGPGDLAGDFGACLSDALCDAQDWFHDHVSSDIFGSCSSSPPPPPQLIDCRVDPCAVDPHACNLDVPVAGQSVQCYGGDPGYSCQGSFCFSESLFSTGQGNYCYCPPEMQRPDGFIQDVYGGECVYYVRCACPDGTTPLSATGAGAYICMCPGGLPVNADGSCPAPPPKCEPSCPAGQTTRISDPQSCTYTCDCPDGQTRVGDTCVAPCADAGEVMLAGGACCAASQATSCGTCCPPGMKPDAGGQSCVSVLAPRLPGGPIAPPQRPRQPPRKL